MVKNNHAYFKEYRTKKENYLLYETKAEMFPKGKKK